VFVAGTSVSGLTSSDYATVAYNAATAAQLWASHYAGTGGDNSASAVAVSPDANMVIVTGSSQGNYSDYATVAYNAATGAQLWASRYDGPLGADGATSIAVSPAGDTVFVTGSTQVEDGYASEYATVAYTAATGKQLWASRYHGRGRRHAAASAVAVGPGGHTVYVTGSSGGFSTRLDYATVAFNAATGAQRWARQYAGPAVGVGAISVAAGPGGRTVYVTGYSTGVTSGADYATIAYNAATGARRWVSRYNWPGNRADQAYSLAVSPAGGMVFVTGSSFGGAGLGSDFATIAYKG
jgi:hypothetical protein